MTKSKTKEFIDLPERPADFEPDKKELSTKKNKILKATAFLKNHYDFVYNLVTNYIEWKEKGETEYKIWTDRAHRIIKTELDIRSGVEISDDAFKNLIHSPRLANEVHPFHDYFNNLEPWNKKTDHIEEFLKQIQLNDESMRTYLINGVKKWLVGMVKGLYIDVPHMWNHNNICLVLYGGQNIHKTTFLGDLIPQRFRLDYLYTGNYVISGNKDHEEMLGTKWLINLEELASFNRTEVENIKGRISQDQVVLTRRYGKAETRLKRRASFCGTTNNKEFITDMTGSRRFLVYDVRRIEYNKKKFDLDKIYAQAFALWHLGFINWITEEDTTLVNHYNEQFRLKTFEEELVVKHFAKPSKLDYELNNYEGMTASDINASLTEQYNKLNMNNTTVKNIGRILSRLGYDKISKRVNGIPAKLWAVVPAQKYIEKDQGNLI